MGSGWRIRVRLLATTSLVAVWLGASPSGAYGVLPRTALAACSDTSGGSDVSSAPIDVALDVQPTTVSQDNLDQLTVRGVVTNHGDAPIDTQLVSSELLVNGQPSFAWGLAIGNGLRDMRETALPPGEQVAFSRVMGKSLAQGPGDYEMVLRVLGVDSPAVQVHVD